MPGPTKISAVFFENCSSSSSPYTVRFLIQRAGGAGRASWVYRSMEARKNWGTILNVNGNDDVHVFVCSLNMVWTVMAFRNMM